MRGQRSWFRSNNALLIRLSLAVAIASFSLLLSSCPNPASVDQVLADLGLSVVETIPPNGATNFDPGQAIVVSFNKDLDPSCLQGIPPVLISGTSITLSFSYKSDTKQLVITPHPYLQSNATYTVSFGTSLRDASGNALPNKVDLSFTTGENLAGDIELNSGAPYVTSAVDHVPMTWTVNRTDASNIRVHIANSDIVSGTLYDGLIGQAPSSWPIGLNEGAKNFVYQFFASNSNVKSAIRSATVVRDTQPPTMSVPHVSCYCGGANSPSNPIHPVIDASDSTSGIASYSWTGAGVVRFITSPPYSTQSPAVTVSGSDGSYSGSIEVTDRAGNSATSQVMTLTKDTRAPDPPIPTLDVTVSPTLSRAGIQWSWSASLSTNLYNTPADSLSVLFNGVPLQLEGTSYSLTPVVSDGTYTITVVQTDAAGNKSQLEMPVIVTPVIPYDGSKTEPTSLQLEWRDFGNGRNLQGSWYRVHIWSVNQPDFGGDPLPGNTQISNSYDFVPGQTYCWYIDFSPDGKKYTIRNPSTEGTYYTFTVIGGR